MAYLFPSMTPSALERKCNRLVAVSFVGQSIDFQQGSGCRVKTRFRTRFISRPLDDGVVGLVDVLVSPKRLTFRSPVVCQEPFPFLQPVRISERRSAVLTKHKDEPGKLWKKKQNYSPRSSVRAPSFRRRHEGKKPLEIKCKQNKKERQYVIRFTCAPLASLACRSSPRLFSPLLPYVSRETDVLPNQCHG